MSAKMGLHEQQKRSATRDVETRALSNQTEFDCNLFVGLESGKLYNLMRIKDDIVILTGLLSILHKLRHCDPLSKRERSLLAL